MSNGGLHLAQQTTQNTEVEKRGNVYSICWDTRGSHLLYVDHGLQSINANQKNNKMVSLNLK